VIKKALRKSWNKPGAGQDGERGDLAHDILECCLRSYLCKSQIRSFGRLEAIAIQYFSPTERNTHGPGLAITR
jgi:hypothetical protein